ncbi:hypothetical protein FG386_000147 [Cryptosporidium ryanae]|uniref:uncharacterized protein n=1 Tax=Cryptosporidium ryanae TaxID=515981 RepID=UPI003519EBD4|nr:hypothetical protein FG386_000147 [Cryptosporidium ryanae]
MWCIPKKLSNTYNTIESDFSAIINKKALLVSGEIEEIKGCTNDIIEYAIILSKVYKYKEIRILQSEFSERLYGNFPSLTLNQLEGGTVVQIVRLTKKSLIEGFRWLLLAPLSVNDYIHTDYSLYYNNDLNVNSRIINSYYKGNELVFAYSGKSKLIQLLNNGKELVYEPQFYISKDEKVPFSEIEDILTTNKSNKGILTSITCFMDCEYGHLFLLNYTREVSLNLRNGINLDSNIEICHSRIKTLPDMNTINNNENANDFGNKAEENDNVNGEVEININKDVSEKSHSAIPVILGINKNIHCDPNISVVIFSSCLPNQTSQELTVCSNNGLNLSIIYRGLFSYSFHQFIKQNLMNYNYNNSNSGIFQIQNGGYNNRDMFCTKVENAFSFTLEYVLEELKNNMSYLINKNQLNEQFPVLTTSPNIVRGRSKLFQVSFNAHIFNTSCYYSAINNSNYNYGYCGYNRKDTSEHRSIQGFGNNNINLSNIDFSRNVGNTLAPLSSIQTKKKETQYAFPPQFPMEKNEEKRDKTENNTSYNGVFGGLLSSNKRVYASNNNLEGNNYFTVKYDALNQNITKGECSTYSSESVLLNEISKLKSELEFIKKSVIKNQSIGTSLYDGSLDSHHKNKFNINNNYLQQLYNTDSVFKKSIRNPIGGVNCNRNTHSGHFRTFTSK